MNLKAKFATLRKELTLLKAGLKSIDSELSQTQTELDDTRRRLKSIESESVSLKSEAHELRLQLQAQERELIEQVLELEARKKELQERLDQWIALKKSSGKLKTDFSAYRTTVENEIAGLKTVATIFGIGAAVLVVAEVITIIIAVTK